MSVLENEITQTLSTFNTLLEIAKSALRDRADKKGRLPHEDQYAAHSFAWVATMVEAIRQMLQWHQSLRGQGRAGEVEDLLLQLICGEYAGQILGGIPMNQGEMARLSDFLPRAKTILADEAANIRDFASRANSSHARQRLSGIMTEMSGIPGFGDCGLDEETEDIRMQIRRLTAEKVIPQAQQWHLDNALIPGALVTQLSEMGIFGLTVPEEFGGAGLSKIVMCVVSEELSRGFLGAGSLATRSDIASELVFGAGTASQKDEFLPKIASGEFWPTAVFTEPDAGSDLGALATRAIRVDGGYRLVGAKTWITHAARANFMTILARTDPQSDDHRGLSILLAEKQAGGTETPFPDAGISGSEIDVIGYRGMKEYSLNFDGFWVPAQGLLGGVEGLGFRQLMATFESARIQTAARAIGVAQSALDVALDYARQRRQFGRTLLEFPRVASKIAMMAAEVMACRQLTYFAARRKDSGQRCDVQAGMAKLLAARVAWAAADNGVQIHGGNGFALECPASRILCDARILSLFEGASEIQAEVIASRLLSDAASEL